VYGGTEGRDAMYLKLISDDGFEFILKTKYAFLSPQIKGMALGPAEIVTLEVLLKFPWVIKKFQLQVNSIWDKDVLLWH